MNAQDNPYQSPQPIEGAGAALYRQDTYERWASPYVSGHTRAMCVVFSLAATIAALCLVVGFLVLGMRAWYQVLHGTPAEFESALQGVLSVRWGLRLLTILLGGAFLTTSIAFLMWIHRVQRNLPALGAGSLRFSPGWAVAYFFIP